MIIITGASKGIGKYLFGEFQKTNPLVFGTYYSTYPGAGVIKFFEKVDISNYFDVKRWVEKISMFDIDITLINCAGINYDSFAHKADIDKWKEVININLIGTFNVIHAILPIMREQGYGRIINLSSVVAQIGIPGTSAYAASKAGLCGMIKSIAIENASKGITINNLNLGYFNIGMINEMSEGFQTTIKNKIPTGNFGTLENILNAVRFLMKSDYVNGTSIDINAGLF